MEFGVAAHTFGTPDNVSMFHVSTTSRARRVLLCTLALSAEKGDHHAKSSAGTVQLRALPVTTQQSSQVSYSCTGG